MRKADMVRTSAEQLFIVEDAVETALSEVARLGAMLGEGRMKANLSAVVGQDAFDDLATLYKRLSKARKVAVQLHGSLDRIKTQIGARTVMVGDHDGKPTQPTGRTVHVVGDEAA